MKESTQKLIDALERRMLEAARLSQFVRDNEQLLENLPDISLYWHSLDFDHLSHEQVLAVIKAFGGRWNKTVNGEDRIDYSLKREDGIEIRCWAGEPPPSCKLIEEEIEIPAQPARKEKRMKLICKDESKPLAELEVA